MKKYSILLLPGWRPRISFHPSQNRYNTILILDLKVPSNVKEGWKFLVQVVLGSLPKVPTNDTIKCIKNAPKRQKEKKNVCAASVVGSQLLELLHWAKIGLNGWRYENRSIFFFVVTVSKEKRSFFKIFIFSLLKVDFCQVDVSKTTIFLETFWNEK